MRIEFCTFQDRIEERSKRRRKSITKEEIDPCLWLVLMPIRLSRWRTDQRRSLSIHSSFFLLHLYLCLFLLLFFSAFRRCCLIKISGRWKKEGERERKKKWKVINLNRIWHNSTHRMLCMSARIHFLFIECFEEAFLSSIEKKTPGRSSKMMIKVWERHMMAVAPPIEYVNHVSFLSSFLSSWMRIRWTEVFLFHSLISFNVNDERRNDDE